MRLDRNKPRTDDVDVNSLDPEPLDALLRMLHREVVRSRKPLDEAVLLIEEAERQIPPDILRARSMSRPDESLQHFLKTYYSLSAWPRSMVRVFARLLARVRFFQRRIPGG